MTTKTKQAEREEARTRLLEILKPGDTVHTVLRHVSSSGMSRRIDLYKLEGGEPIYLSAYAAKACGFRLSDKGGIVAGGCGMDMGFHLVYELGAVLWPKGVPCTGKAYGEGACRSNDHSNGDRDYKPHDHRDGGYALRHRWL